MPRAGSRDMAKEQSGASSFKNGVQATTMVLTFAESRESNIISCKSGEGSFENEMMKRPSHEK
jgi:hypothetical protein